MIDDTYEQLRVQADRAEKTARELENSDYDEVKCGIAWFKVMAIRGEMLLRHAESYNGFPGADQTRTHTRADIPDLRPRDYGGDD